MGIFKQWQQQHDSDIEEVSRYVYGDPSYICPDFQKLAWFIYSTEINLHSFLPKFWSSCKSSAHLMRAFLDTLQRHYTDDGDMCFIDMGPRYGSVLSFNDGTNDEHVRQAVREACGGITPASVKFDVHHDVDRFIASVKARG